MTSDPDLASRFPNTPDQWRIRSFARKELSLPAGETLELEKCWKWKLLWNPLLQTRRKDGADGCPVGPPSVK